MTQGESDGYCPNCGTGVGPSDEVCDACGASLVQAETGEGDPHPTGSAASADPDREGRSRGVLGHPGMRWSSLLRDAREAPGAAVRRFREASVAKKMGMAAVSLLLLAVLAGASVLMSPLLVVASALLFSVSLIGLIVRAGQRWTGLGASFVGWGVTAATSLALVFAFAGVSGALYGGWSAESAAPSVSEAAGDSPYVPSSGRGQYQAGTADDVDPELEPIVKAWRSSGSETPLFLPTYLPFDVALLDTDEYRRLEDARMHTDLDLQHARREVERLHLVVRLLSKNPDA